MIVSPCLQAQLLSLAYFVDNCVHMACLSGSAAFLAAAGDALIVRGGVDTAADGNQLGNPDHRLSGCRTSAIGMQHAVWPHARRQEH
jgi:hypothetical protein